MEDKQLIFWGTFGLLIYNIMVVILAIFAFNSLSVVWALVFTCPLAIGAIYFDVLVARYFINKIKEKTKKN